MKNRIIIAASLALALISQNALAGSIADTYATDDTLTAVKMDNIKAAVNDNDTRTTANAAAIALESGALAATGVNAAAIALESGALAATGVNAAGIATNSTVLAIHEVELARALVGASSDFGIKTNVTLASLTSAGWTECFSETYDIFGATTVASVLATCNQANLMLACRLVATPTAIILAASAPRADVTFDTLADLTTSHYANGAEWYFNENKSWGFALAGDPVNKTNCDFGDTTGSDYRMCIHTGGGTLNDGYRCGATITFGATYERVFLHKN